MAVGDSEVGAALVVTEEVEVDSAETGEEALEVTGEVVDLEVVAADSAVTAVVLEATEEATLASVTGEEEVDLVTGEATEVALVTDPAGGSRDWTFKEAVKKEKLLKSSFLFFGLSSF